MGLSYLAKKANRVVGCDIDEDILKYPNETYKDREDITVMQADAQDLPFDDNSFDVVMLYEAIYYLPEPEKFVNEAKRILKDGGVLIVCTVNKEWSGFNPSPYTFKYFSASEFHALLSQEFSNTELYGAFPSSTGSTTEKILLLIKRLAVTFRLIPKTMKAKEYLKRLFFGKLTPLPREIDDHNGEYQQPQLLDCSNSDGQYKILYAVAYV
ncbi:2-methoxy-6-polyprenyl-1,4-benzoquinol methylase [subsurface metagenome]|jgi:ubiquinone/menaquinone biosynthesis C-methylase UbiE